MILKFLCYNKIMDKLEYLNQISQSSAASQAKPSKAPSQLFSKVTNSLILKILIGGIVATIALIGIGILINNTSTRSSDLVKQLYVRITNVNKTISTYNNNLKSSQLRSINYSLGGTLTGTSTQLSAYLKATYPDEENPLAPPPELAEVESKDDTLFNDSLARAKLNGILDRVYASQILLQVNLIMSSTSEILARDPSTSLRDILESFYSNLTPIQQSLDAYSNPSD